jgi:hypothetical protein
LTLGEGDNGNRVVAVSDINKADVSWCLGVLGQISLGDTVTESDGGRVIDQSKGVQSGDSSSVGNSSSLDIGIVSGNGDDDIGNSLLQFNSRRVT